MSMSDVIQPMMLGFVMGILFFNGLWITISKAIHSPNAAQWIVLSLSVRVALVMVGFFLICDGNFFKVLLCLVGFLIGRAIGVRRAYASKSR